MRIFEITRASRELSPEDILPDDLRTGDFRDEEKRAVDKKLSDLTTEVDNKLNALQLDIYPGALRYLRNNIKLSDLKHYVTDDAFENIKQRWTEIEPIVRRYIRKKDALINQEKNKAAKIGIQKGIGPEDSKKLIDLVRQLTSKSYQKLDARAIPLLQKLTVTPSRLPKYVYRGIFYDGAKIKDKEKWLEKWRVGSKPKEKCGKATSWSVDKATAVQFMTSQDRVKDHENGFHVLLRYEITDPSVVVADLRSLPDNTFWNQQEILLSKDAIDYEVISVFSNKDPDFKLFSDKERRETYRFFGYNYTNSIINNFLKNDPDIDPIYLQQWRPIKDWTFGQFRKKYKAEINFPDDALFPLAAFCRRLYRVKYINETTVQASETILLWSNTAIYDSIKEIIPELGMIPKAIFDLKIELVQNNFNNFVFYVTPIKMVMKNHEKEIDGSAAQEILVDHLKTMVGFHGPRVKTVWR